MDGIFFTLGEMKKGNLYFVASTLMERRLQTQRDDDDGLENFYLPFDCRCPVAAFLSLPRTI